MTLSQLLRSLRRLWLGSWVGRIVGARDITTPVVTRERSVGEQCRHVSALLALRQLVGHPMNVAWSHLPYFEILFLVRGEPS